MGKINIPPTGPRHFRKTDVIMVKRKSTGGYARGGPRRRTGPRRVRKGTAKRRRRVLGATAKRVTIKDMIRNMEQKYCAVTRRDEDAPSAIQVGAITYNYNVLVGTSLPIGWTGSYTPIGGTRIPAGDGINSRDGNVVYLQNTRVQVILDMKHPDTGSTNVIKPPHYFRVVVFKSKIKYLAGGTHDPGTELFLNETDAPFGVKSTGVNGNDLMMFKPNRRDFHIQSDFKFTLAMSQTSMVNEGGSQGNDVRYIIGSNPRYPSQKILDITLPHNKKVTYSNSTNEPENYNPAWCIAIITRCEGQDQSASFWEASVRAATKFKDI